MGTPPPAQTPPPEATVLRLARKARGLSFDAAAERTPIRLGPTRWRQIENGYERKRPFKPAIANDKTLAHMARAVGVTPEQLAEAGRGEAAEVLHEMLRQEEAGTITPPKLVEKPGDPNPFDKIDGFADVTVDPGRVHEITIWGELDRPWQDRVADIEIIREHLGALRNEHELTIWSFADAPPAMRIGGIEGMRREEARAEAEDQNGQDNPGQVRKGA